MPDLPRTLPLMISLTSCCLLLSTHSSLRPLDWVRRLTSPPGSFRSVCRSRGSSAIASSDRKCAFAVFSRPLWTLLPVHCPQVQVVGHAASLCQPTWLCVSLSDWLSVDMSSRLIHQKKKPCLMILKNRLESCSVSKM